MAALGYALAQAVHNPMDAEALARIAGEALRPNIWTGWLAFFIDIPLAATSMDQGIPIMDTRWQAR